MCQNLYTSAAYACEKSMETVGYNGQKVEGCSYVSQNMPSAVKKSMRGGAVFGWFVFAMLIAGFGAYIVWWRKSKFTKPLIEPRKRKWWAFWRKPDLADAVSPHYNAAP
jgi:hypothetical protein